MSMELLIVIKITTWMAAVAEELSKICRLTLLELGNKEYQAVYTDLRQKESINAGSSAFLW